MVKMLKPKIKTQARKPGYQVGDIMNQPDLAEANADIEHKYTQMYQMALESTIPLMSKEDRDALAAACEWAIRQDRKALAAMHGSFIRISLQSDGER